MLRFVILFAAAVSLGMAQLDSHSVTVTATRSLYAAADQVGFSLSVTTDFNSSLDEVVARLKSQGVPAVTLTGLYSFDSKTLTWNFAFNVPLGSVGQTVALLSRLSIGFSGSGFSISDAALSKLRCSYSDLITDALTQARALADAAGMKIGVILAVADRPYSGAANTYGPAPTASLIFADFLLGSAGLITGSNSSSPAQTCSLTAKYQLLQN